MPHSEDRSISPILPIFSRCYAHSNLKLLRKIAGSIEPAQSADLADRKVCAGKLVCCRGDPAVEKILHGRHMDGPGKCPLALSDTDPGNGSKVSDGDRLCIMVIQPCDHLFYTEFPLTGRPFRYLRAVLAQQEQDTGERVTGIELISILP